MLADGDGVINRNTFSCAKVAGDLLYHATVLTASNSSARRVVLIGPGPDAAQTLLDDANTTLMISVPPPSLLSVMQRYLVTGLKAQRGPLLAPVYGWFSEGFVGRDVQL